MTPAAVAAVAIGGSAGGVDAVVRLLGSLGSGFAPPVFLVQHLHRHSGGSLAERLGREAGIRAVEVRDHQRIEPFTVHVAPANYHLLVASKSTLALTVDRPVHHSRPSVDVLFESAADVFGAGLAGVVLTGANADGAGGLAAIRAAGGHCFVQDPESAEVGMMPLAAQVAVPDARALAVEEIGVEIRRIAHERAGSSGTEVARRGSRP